MQIHLVFVFLMTILCDSDWGLNDYCKKLSSLNMKNEFIKINVLNKSQKWHQKQLLIESQLCAQLVSN